MAIVWIARYLSENESKPLGFLTSDSNGLDGESSDSEGYLYM